jgi:hypothetical protein
LSNLIDSATKHLILNIFCFNKIDERDEMNTDSDQPFEQTQSEKFKQAARELECDPDEARWEDKLRKVAKPKESHKK